MVEITTRGRIAAVAASPDELTPAQYARALALSVSLATGAVTPDAARRRLMSMLIGMEDYGALLPGHVAEIDAQLGALDDFFASAPDGSVSMPLDSVANLLPETDGFSGPGDWLEGVSFGEFTECQAVLGALAEGQADPEEIAGAYAHVARTLYRIPEESEVPDILLVHAPRLFMSVWNRICSEPVEINGRRIDFRIIFAPSGPKRPDDGTGWTGITFEVASAGIFGDTRGVEGTDFWSVLLYLYKCKFEYINDKNRNS